MMSLQHGRLRLMLGGLVWMLMPVWIHAAPAVGTAFTYQGRLTMAGAPATGSYDFKFTLYNALTGGSTVGSVVTKSAVTVNGGVFTVTLDYGSSAFNGSPRWLEIAVKPAGGASYTTLSPRQPISPVPYAISVPWSGISAMPAGFADGVDNGTSYTTGSGLALNSNVLSVNYGGTGSAETVARSDHNHWGASWRGQSYGLTLDTTGATIANPVTIAGITRASAGNAIMGVVTETGTYGYMLKQTGVAGLNNGTQAGGYGVYGSAGAANAYGVYGRASGSGGIGVGASGKNYGLFAVSSDSGSTGTYGRSDGASGIGVGGTANGSGGNGVKGLGKYVGVRGTGDSYGVIGSSPGSGGTGVYGYANTGSSAYGVWGYSTAGEAGHFSGKVTVTGTLSKAGGSFKIDHPLDPANKYLQHSFVESPDMMNIYNGNATLDAKGEAVVTLPEWFEALNKDFRYQLTCIGGFAPVFIAEKISKNRFKIAGGTGGLEVSWMVTGVRKDAWANDNRIEVETIKPADEQGTYLYPEGFGQKATLSLDSVRRGKIMPATP